MCVKATDGNLVAFSFIYFLLTILQFNSNRMYKVVKKENNIIVLTLLIGLIATFSLLTYSLLSKVETERDWVEHRRKMELELESILSAFYQMEASQRGYIITKNNKIKETYKKAEIEAFRHLANAYPLTLDVEIQQKRLNKLEGLLKARKKILDEVDRNFQNDSTDQLELVIYQIEKGDWVMDDIRDLIALMINDEKLLLKERLKEAKSYGIGAIVTAVFMGIITILVTVYLYFKLFKGNKEKKIIAKQRERAIEELKQSEVRYRSLNESLNDAIIISNKEGKIISWNRAAQNTFGYTESEALEQSIDLILPEQINAKQYVYFRKFLQNERPTSLGNKIELIGKNKKGKQLPTQITLSQWEVDGENFYSFVIRDITALREAHEIINATVEELRRSNEDLEQFAYVASHDLQEPLRKIRAFGDRLVAKYSNNPEFEGKEYIDRMVDGAERMQTLISDLLTFSRISRDDSKMEKVDLNEVINSTLDNLQITIQETNSTINVEKLPLLSKANPVQMGQLFQNLISNAIKFRKPDVEPIVTITSAIVKGRDIDIDDIKAEPNKQYYKITISDNGIGFDIKYIDRIFTIFQRLHNRDTYKGTGIGLAICKKICKNHQGFISAESSDEGAKFIVILPKKIKSYEKR